MPEDIPDHAADRELIALMRLLPALPGDGLAQLRRIASLYAGGAIAGLPPADARFMAEACADAGLARLVLARLEQEPEPVIRAPRADLSGMHFKGPIAGRDMPVFAPAPAGERQTILAPQALGPLPVLPFSSPWRLTPYAIPGPALADAVDEIERQRRWLTAAVVADRAAVVLAGPDPREAWAGLLAARTCGVRFVLIEGEAGPGNFHRDVLAASADATVLDRPLQIEVLPEFGQPQCHSGEDGWAALRPMLSAEPFPLRTGHALWRRVGRAEIVAAGDEGVALTGPALPAAEVLAVFRSEAEDGCTAPALTASPASPGLAVYRARLAPGGYRVLVYLRQNAPPEALRAQWSLGAGVAMIRERHDIRAVLIEGAAAADMAELAVQCRTRDAGHYVMTVQYPDAPRVPSWAGRLIENRRLGLPAQKVELTAGLTQIAFARPKRGAVLLELARRPLRGAGTANGVISADMVSRQRANPAWFVALAGDLPTVLAQQRVAGAMRAVANVVEAAADDPALFSNPSQPVIDLGVAAAASPQAEAAALIAIDRASGGFDGVLARETLREHLTARPAMRERLQVPPKPRPRDRRLLIAAHDFRFAETLEAGLLARGVWVHRQTWRKHVERLETGEGRMLAETNTVFCDWCLGNAVWWSRNAPRHVRLVVRLHAQELLTGFPGRVDFGRVDQVIFVSPHVMRQAQAQFGIPPDKCEFARIAPAHLPSNPPLPERRDTIGLVGLSPWIKRPDRALRFVMRLRQRFPVTLQIKGAMPSAYAWMQGRDQDIGAYLTAFKALAEAEAQGIVRFQPYGDDMADYYRNIGWLLSVSEREGCHAAVAEAGVMGAVPLIGNWAGADEIYPPDLIHGSLEAMEDYFVQAYDRHLEVSKDVAQRFQALYSTDRIADDWWRILFDCR